MMRYVLEPFDIINTKQLPTCWARPWRWLNTRPATHISTINQQKLWIVNNKPLKLQTIKLFHIWSPVTSSVICRMIALSVTFTWEVFRDGHTAVRGSGPAGHRGDFPAHAPEKTITGRYPRCLVPVLMLSRRHRKGPSVPSERKWPRVETNWVRRRENSGRN